MIASSVSPVQQVCVHVSAYKCVYTCECVSDSIGDFANGETDSLREMRQSPYGKIR
jgi:hypothetical protein